MTIASATSSIHVKDLHFVGQSLLLPRKNEAGGLSSGPRHSGTCILFQWSIDVGWSNCWKGQVFVRIENCHFLVEIQKHRCCLSETV